MKYMGQSKRGYNTNLPKAVGGPLLFVAQFRRSFRLIRNGEPQVTGIREEVDVNVSGNVREFLEGMGYR